MKNLKVRTKLSIGFGILMFLTATIVLDAILTMQSIKSDLDKIVEQNIYKMTLVQDMSESVHIVSRVTRTMILLQDDAAIKAEEERIKAARAKYDMSVELLEKTPANDAGKVIRTKMREARLASRPLTDSVLEFAKTSRDAEAVELLLKQAAPATQKWQDALDENIALQLKQNKIDEDDAHHSYESGVLILIVLSAMTFILGIGAAFIITRGLLKQLGGEPGYAAAIAGSIAEGDLNVAVNLKPNDHSSLLFAMKTMRDNLSGIVAQVRAGTDTIATASSQIAAGNLDLSSRTEEQASSLEETASSMEELTSTVKQNADNARQANSMAMSASDVARKGGAVVAEVVGTMSAINDSSRKIVDIISVIDGIAFQTNILALNAAVEAARAGEQGRGFAVVASEVRNLAQRSAAAAKEIKTLIGDSVEKVDVGAKLVDQAGATMSEIVESVKRVTDIMGEITAASQEQTAGIEQINIAITQMDEVTQQNAALVEEAAAAAESMQDQASKLQEVVAIFKISGEHDLVLDVGRSKAGIGAKPKASPSTSFAGTRKPARAPAMKLAVTSPRRAIPTLSADGDLASNLTKPGHHAGGDWEEF